MRDRFATSGGALPTLDPRWLVAWIGVPIFAALMIALAHAGFQASPSENSIRHDYASLPLAFERNAGQAPEAYDFMARSASGAAAISDNGAVVRVGDDNRTAAIGLDLVDSRPSEPTALSRLPGMVNYLKGDDSSKWETGIPTYERVRYLDVYPGIAVDWYGNQRRLEYDFRVSPGADPSQIGMHVRGAEEVRVAPNGDLVIDTGEGSLRQRAPLAYQLLDGERQVVDAAYTVRGNHVGFRLGTFDSSRPLVIDPLVLDYSTFLGGGFSEVGNDIAVDDSGAAYIGGQTSSIDFPVTPGAFSTSAHGTAGGNDQDGFVTKLNPAGTALVFSTYIGGGNKPDPNTGIPDPNSDRVEAIAVDASGAPYITGDTRIPPDFPTTPQAFQTSPVGPVGVQNGEAFVAKLTPDGSGLVYSTYLGGAGEDFGTDIALDDSGRAYVTGLAGAGGPAFPTTAGAFDTSQNGSDDAFLSKLSADGSSLLYSTVLGGPAVDAGRAVRLDDSGSAYVGGFTSSTNFPSSAGAFDTTVAGQDGFLARIDPNGAGAADLGFSSFYGGTGNEQILDLARDASGDLYITGSTNSLDLPTTPGAFDTSHNGPPAGPPPFGVPGSDAFAAKLSQSGSTLVYGTYLGGNGNENGQGVTVDQNGVATLVGITASTNFPTADAIDAAANGGNDVFLTQLSADGSALRFSTYIGGGGADTGLALAQDKDAAFYVTGNTASTGFPTTSGAFDESFNGISDAFVLKLVPSADLALTKTDSPDPVGRSGEITYTLSVENLGPDSAPGVEIVDTLPAGADFVSASPGCGHAAGVVTCSVGTVANGATASVQIVARTLVEGTITNNATVSHQGADPLAGNDSASEDTTVFPVSDLDFAKSVDSSTATPGDVLTYTLSATNRGPSTSPAPTVTDTLPEGLTYVSDDGSCDTSALPKVTCVLPALANGSSAEVHVTARVELGALGKTLTNGAEVAVSIDDPAPANNRDVVDVAVVDPDFDTIIVKRPVTANYRKTILRFRAIEDGLKAQHATFSCRFDRPGDKGKYKSCRKPIVHRKLEPGDYHFEVFATSEDGFVDKTPAKVNFTIDPRPKLRHTNRDH